MHIYNVHVQIQDFSKGATKLGGMECLGKLPSTGDGRCNYPIAHPLDLPLNTVISGSQITKLSIYSVSK